MNKKDINELKEIVQQAKRLEELIKEIEGLLTDEQSKNLSHEVPSVSTYTLVSVGFIMNLPVCGTESFLLSSSLKNTIAYLDLIIFS